MGGGFAMLKHTYRYSLILDPCQRALVVQLMEKRALPTTASVVRYALAKLAEIEGLHNPDVEVPSDQSKLRAQVLRAWPTEAHPKGLTTKKLIELAFHGSANHDLRAALIGISLQGEAPSAMSIGRALAYLRGKTYDGLKLIGANDRVGKKVWSVVVSDEKGS